MKSLADKCVLAYNEAEKRKSLGRPGIDPRMAAKKKKKLPADQPAPSSQEAPRIIFPQHDWLEAKGHHNRFRTKEDEGCRG